jgi:hypothetical protein
MSHASALMVSFLVPYYLILGDRAAGRYLVILVPVYCLCVARLVQLAERWPPVSRDRYRVVNCAEQPEWAITVGGLGRIEQALASGYLLADYSWDPGHKEWWPDGKPAPPDRLQFYDQLLPGRDGHADYSLAAAFSRERLPTVPFDVSTVKVWRRAR